MSQKALGRSMMVAAFAALLMLFLLTQVFVTGAGESKLCGIFLDEEAEPDAEPGGSTIRPAEAVDSSNSIERPEPTEDNPNDVPPKSPAPATAAPATAAPGTSAPGTSAPGTSAPGTSAPETATPGTSAPATATPGTSAPETCVP